MDTTTLLAGSGVALSIFGIIYSAINHRHIRLRLCNNIYDFSIDVGTTNEEENRKKEEEENRKKEEENRKKEEEENRKKEEEENRKKEEENKKKITYTPYNFKIKPIKFDV